jgi:ATP-dependent DNA helicase PIF1
MWTEGGVVNGAMGILRHLIVNPADSSVDTDGIRPVVALVEMQNFKCTNPLVPSQPKLVPIRMCTHEWTVGHGKYLQACSRTQLPLELAWAITIHKSQGLTIGPGHNIQKVVIDVGATEHWAPGLLYVAVSRANNLGCIAFDPIRITECGQIERLDFYAIERFTRLNSSNGSQKTFAHLRHLDAMQASRRQHN